MLEPSFTPLARSMTMSRDDDSPADDMPGNELPADLAPLEATPNASAEIDPYQQSSLRAREAFAEAARSDQQGNKPQAVQEYLRCAAAAEAAHEWYLVATACERVGDFLLSPQPPTDTDRALRMYRRAAAAYEHCGLFTEARRLSYHISWLRLWQVRTASESWIQRAELFLYWLTAGFGYRPTRVIGTSLVAVLIYGILYWLLGGAIETETRQAAGLLDSLYFSGITFATVGYGDLIPAPHVRLLAFSEGFLGAFLIGFFVVVLAHRLARTV